MTESVPVGTFADHRQARQWMRQRQARSRLDRRLFPQLWASARPEGEEPFGRQLIVYCRSQTEFKLEVLDESVIDGVAVLNYPSTSA